MYLITGSISFLCDVASLIYFQFPDKCRDCPLFMYQLLHSMDAGSEKEIVV